MRVTTASMFATARAQVAQGQSEAQKLRSDISTGKRVTSYGDDPMGAEVISRQRTKLADITAHRASLDRAEHSLGVTENSLAGTHTAIVRIREIATQFANSTYNAQDRAVAANDLVQIRAQLVELGNTRLDGRYLFGGLGNAGAPFDAAGAFTGDNGQLVVPVTRSATMPTTLPGGEPFVDAAGGPSVFDTITSLETALRADDGAAVGALIAEVEVHEFRITASQQQVGNFYGRLEALRSAFDRTEIAANATMSAAQDTDMVQAILELQSTEDSLRAALSVTARLEQISLLNYL